MSKILKTFLKFLSIIITVLYPFLIYYLLSNKSSFHVISLILLLVVVINFLKIKSIIILFIGLILTLFLSFTNNEIFLKIYPVCMNLIVSLAFLGSLLKTPLITLFAQKLKYEIIIVDTSGRHKQEDALFEEMKQVSAATSPNDIIFVMDSHIGQACHAQAEAFKKTVDIGSVIITKLDGHAKGGGALSAVAATESPIIFIGTGEHFEDFEQFNPESFIKRLLGMGDIKGLFEKVQEVISKESQEKLTKNLAKGIFSLRDMRDQYTSVMKMGPLDKVMNMIPGMSNIMPEGSEKEATKKMKKYLCIMDSMTDGELDGKQKIDESRIKRIARGSGALIVEVQILLNEYKNFQKMVGKMGGLIKGGGSELTEMQRNPSQFMNKLGGMLPQNLLQQMGGTGNIMNMMKEFQSLEGMSGLMKGAKGRRGKK